MTRVKSVVVLGSTGSIGRQALEVLSALKDRFTVEALACGRNWRLAAEQALAHRPKRVAVADPSGRRELASALVGTGIEVSGGRDAVLEVAGTRADITLAAIAGSAGVAPTLAAAGAARVLALANKEALVEAGTLLLARVRQAQATLLPVDSEHSAILQGLAAGRREDVRRIILTASGGPFYGLTPEELKRVTPAEALAHPTWRMGEKITVDSATLINKAFEVVEAHWLFGLDGEAIGVLIHPESVVHGLVEFRDGSVLAQMGLPDMRLPIQYALTWPERAEACGKGLSLAAVGRLRFTEPDLGRFPGLGLGWELIRRGGTSGAAAVRANEVARGAFLGGRLPFPCIYEVIRRVLDEHREEPVTGLDDVERTEAWAEQQAQKALTQVT